MDTNSASTKRTFTETEIDELSRIVIALKQLTKKDVITCTRTVGDCVGADFSQKLMIERKAFDHEEMKERNAK